MGINMKKILLLVSLCSLLALGMTAQTQTGYVKTRGRLVNGKHVAGQGLAGATVQIKGRASVLVKNSNGKFSFPVNAPQFVIQSVKKNGYQLVDADAAPKAYTYSSAPVYLVMETPSQLLEDKLASERKLRRTLMSRLQKREDEIEALKQQNRLSLQQYHNALQQLYDQQESNEKLIAEMADYYSRIDYDQIDEFNRQVSELILAGDLSRADSLLRSKGDIDERIKRLNEHHEANLHAREMLEKSEKAEQLNREDLARDCYSFFKRFVLDNEFDSAARYIEKRASLDPANSQWQADAGNYLQQRGKAQQAVKYYNLALESARKLAQVEPEQYEPLLANTLNNISLLYAEAGNLAGAEPLFNEAIGLYRRLSQADAAYMPLLASALNNHAATLLENEADLDRAESLFAEALDIYRDLCEGDPDVYSPQMAATMCNMGLLYDGNQRFEDSERMFKQALERYRQLGAGTGAYESDYALALGNLSALYFKNGDHLFDSRQMLAESLDIYRRLAADDWHQYAPMVAMALNNLSVMDFSINRPEEGKKSFLEALDIYRKLVNTTSRPYLPILAKRLYDQAIRYYQDDDMEKSESLFSEALEAYRSLCSWDADRYQPEVARVLRNLANVCDKRQQWARAEELYQEELAINRQLADGNPGEYAAHVARSYGNLSNHAILMGNFPQAVEYAQAGIAIDETRHFIQANLAAALLFMGETGQARAIYAKYKNELRDVFLDDFKQFEAQGVIPNEARQAVMSIKELLQQ